jgi:phage terminase large subunit
MTMNFSDIFTRNVAAMNNGAQIIVNKGGARSTKTWSIMQLLWLICQKSEKGVLISVVSESIPHLKRGCIRDFQTMMQDEWKESAWNATDKIYTFGKSRIEFFSADTPDKVHGPARDILFINECIDIPFEIYRQLAIRTRGLILLDYNPREEFWIDDKILPRDGVTLIRSTYKDNPFLSARQIEEIESNKDDINWWKVYGLGETGSREGLCIRNWDIVTELPATCKRRYLGMDFGFATDPTAIIDVRLSGGELWLDQLCYESGMTNNDIAERVKDMGCGGVPIVADSAEPKSVQELRYSGLHVEPSVKGADSIRNGIDVMNRYRIHVTQRSIDLIKELRNYKYRTDTDGRPTNVPIDKFNHAIDAARYVIQNKFNSRPSGGGASAAVGHLYPIT